MTEENQTTRSKPSRFYYALLLVVSMILALVAIGLPLLSSTLATTPEEGQVALRDYRAPQTVTYVSEVLTEQRRDAAERSVAPVYTSLDTRVARQQLEQLRSALDYISTVQADTFASDEQKMDDLAALEDVSLSAETVNTILDLSDARWLSTQQEALVVLEKVMSSPIRPETMDTAIARVPSQVSLSLPESQADVVAELVAALIEPNSVYSEELTETAKQKAREAVEPVNRTYIAGQSVALEGQVLDEEEVEALVQLGLVQPEQNWGDWVGAIALVLLMAAFMLLYLRRNQMDLLGEARSMAVIALLFLIFLLSARLALPAHAVLPYVFPLAAYGLTVAALFGPELAIVSSLPLVFLVSFGLSESFDLTIFYLVTSLFGILSLGRARRITSFFRAGAVIAITGTIVVVVYHLPNMDAVGLATLAGAAVINGLASASLGILLQFFLAQLLGMISPMQLMDLSRPDHPLLQILLQEAPGTYQHSLQVANLAEQAAERIGADPLLTRVGTLYHDVGKTKAPSFFIENQPIGFPNPHDLLPPLDSSQIIQMHVTDGLELGRKYRLPRRIMDFIAEHHGTMLTRYQYFNALNGVDGDESLVDESAFRYPGPNPSSRETAILMLADGCEARVRAEHPEDVEALRKLIKDMVDKGVEFGQLDETNLTFHDLSEIVDSFTTTMRGVYHPRVQYPQLESGVVEDPTPVVLPEAAETSAELPADVRSESGA